MKKKGIVREISRDEAERRGWTFYTDIHYRLFLSLNWLGVCPVSFLNTELKADLAATKSIGGSAVVPNLEADETWKAEVGSLQQEFNSKIAAEKDRIQSMGNHTRSK